LLLAVVGFADVLQQAPRAVIAAPPSDKMVPPHSAVVSVIALTAAVDTVGATGWTGSVVLSSEQEQNNARDTSVSPINDHNLPIATSIGIT